MTEADGCPVTVWPDLAKAGHNNRGVIKVRGRQCGEPLAPGARFCVKHEADRIRLSGDAA